MKHAALSCVVFLVALSASAQQPFRTYVSGNGSDSHPACAITSPCRTLAQAISVVAPGGEVIALDTAGYGANLTISKAVSILIPDGIYGVVTAASGDAITISAGSSDVVRIKGLNIVANGTSGNGIFIFSGGFVYLDDITVRGFGGGDGIFTFANTQVYIARSNIRDCNSGIGVNLASSGYKTVVTNSKIENSVTSGIFAEGYGSVIAKDTVVAHAGNSAFYARSTVDMVAPEITIQRCVVSDSNVGVYADTGSVIRMGDSTIVGNSTGVLNSGGTLYTWADNDVHGNPGGDVTGDPMSGVTKQ